MSSGTLVRLSGRTLFVSSLLLVLVSVVSLFLNMNDPKTVTSAFWLLVQLVSLLASLFFLVGLPVVYLYQAARVGWLGLVGFVLTFFSSLLFDIGLGFLFLIVLPYIAVTVPKSLSSGGPPTLFVFYIVAGLMFSGGSILLGLATMRAGMLPRGAGLLLLLSGVIGLINSIPLPAFFSNLVGTVSGIVFFLGLAWAGYAIVSRSEAAVEPLQSMKKGATNGKSEPQP